MFGFIFGKEKVTKTTFDQAAYSVLIDEVLCDLDEGSLTREDALYCLQKLRQLEISGEDPIPYLVGMKKLLENDDQIESFEIEEEEEIDDEEFDEEKPDDTFDEDDDDEDDHPYVNMR